MHNKDLYVCYCNNKFIFNDDDETYLGSFDINQLVKYLGEKHNNNFMKNICGNDYDNAVYIIEQFVGKVDKDNSDNKSFNIIVYGHTRSPFMGNIEMIMHLNKSLDDFKNMHLHRELSLIDVKKRSSIERTLNQFIYILLNYTLQIVSHAINMLNPNQDNMKQLLLQYSTKIMNKITLFVQSQLNLVMKKNDEIEKIQLTSAKLQHKLEKKFNVILEEIKKHNVLLRQQKSSMNTNTLNKQYSPNVTDIYSGGYINKVSDSESDSESTAAIEYNSNESSSSEMDMNHDINDILTDSDISEIIDETV